MHELRCFGRLAIEDGDGDRVQLRSRKHLALLLYLAAHRDRRHDRGRLARLFWDTEIDLARHSLSQALYDLRQHVPDLDLDRTNREVGLGPEGLVYEGQEFEAAVRNDELGRAVELYGGSFAPDIETVGGSDFERWVERERTRYRSLAEKALLRRVTECSDAGRWGKMCVAGSRLVDMNPLNEEAHRAVMRGLWLQGDREAALSHFDEYQDLLDRELPRGLDQETRNLVGRIRQAGRPGGRPSVHERPRPEMVGREEEFRTLKGALGELKQGQSSFIVVRGEAGIGKTRLLEEFADVAELEDVRLLRSRCYAAESDVPYGPIIDGLGELAREVAESSAEDETEFHQLGHLFPEAFGETGDDAVSYTNRDIFQRRLAEELRHLLLSRAIAGPMVWLIEDLHWADSTSTWLLDFLARRISRGGCLVVATTRERGVAENKDLSAAEWTSLGLSPLSDRDIEHVISASGLKPDNPEFEQVVGRAGGNPFYALELARYTQRAPSLSYDDKTMAPSHGIPDKITEILDAQLDTISGQAAKILRILAVADSPVPPTMIISISGLAVSELLDGARSLYRKQLVQDDDDGLRICHNIVRRYVYHQMDQLSRTALHLEIAAWLDQDNERVEPGTLAFHYHNANVSDKAFAQAMKAANKAVISYAVNEAIHFSEMALDCASSVADKIEAKKLLAEAQYRGGYLTAARKSLKQIQAESDSTPMIRDRSIHLLQAETAIELAEWEEAKRSIGALVENEPDNQKKSVLRARHLLLKAAIREGDHQLARELLEEIEAIPFQEIDVESQALMWMSKAAYRAFLGEVHDCRGYIHFLQSHAPELPNHLVYPARHLGVLVALRLGETQVALKQAQAVYLAASRRHDEVAMATSLNNILTVNIETGSWDQAATTMDQLHGGLVDGIDSPNFRLLLGVNQADYHFYTENFDSAENHYRQIIGGTQQEGIQYVKPELLAGFGLVLAARGKVEGAEEIGGRLEEQYALDEVLQSGIQDRYKIYWLIGYYRWRRGEDNIPQYLRNVAMKEEKMDLPGAARTGWIGHLLGSYGHDTGAPADQRGNGLMQGDAFDELKKYELRWFAYFSRRWLRRTLQ